MIATASVERILLFANVARHGTMTRAAQAVGYSVSAISQQIRKLELEAGQPLLQRHSRGIVLTDAGQAVLAHAEQIHSQLKSLQYSLDDIAGIRAGSLRMGTFPTAGSSLLPLAISRFRSEHAGIDLTVRSFRLAALLSMLNSREISMSLLWDYEWSRLDLPDMEVRLLLDDPTDLVVSATHPLAARDTVTISELLDESWVVRAENHPMIDVIVRAANDVGFQPKVAYEANDYQEVQAMVAVGVGVSLVPRLALTVLRNDVQVIPLSGVVPRRRILLARVKDSHPTGAEIAMTAMLVEAADDLTLASHG
ncbi:LysR family transcriptional regulator [Cryobacterium sp. Y50]|uniref:LysR family transcriptional regulator n=1 Tax=Cryobacterium sp. Y50 TaxID=2048286 RepID=UPI0018ED36FA|nr:LysR family transcriptional regulator [Cryobacterium sp. Y50]